ncbi:hypothetical protein SAMN04488519_10915 [Algoriphagus ornithinivorans]|uniref:Uncharacterized protein n=1 Tax=Algoriphagus ornithinivorans TaxID=226506 RepID=A0A1I5IJT4_9BACT|nr:hypothetical protein [Algoriphagus ornithinivorans]SFO60391.1 hypothetical protein SAMN04488519_10915 [Algoriphagus ornithinivorans]
MSLFEESILRKLKEINFKPQGVIGEAPSSWSMEMGLKHEFSLSDNILDRESVRKICLDINTDPLIGYLHAMAWGGQGKGPGGKSVVNRAWNNKEIIKDKLYNLRKGRSSRFEAYNLFSGKNEVPGLGPAYFTKLLYFFSPEPNMYIMDQWTTKPILLLTGKNIIRHTSQGPTKFNTGKNYELFCSIIDYLAPIIGAQNGDEVEQRLFSVGSIKKKPRGEFRQYVFDLWNNRPKFNRYQEKMVDELLLKINESN